VRTKVTLVLIFLNVALFFFIFKFERTWRTEAASLEARRRVFGAEAADIRSLEVASGTPAGSYRLERRRETWFLTKPLEWPANPHAAAAIANELQTLEHDASFSVADLEKNRQTLAEFGLEKPKVVVTFASGDPATGQAAPPSTTTLRIGDATPDGKRLYVLSPRGDRVHVVGRSLIDSLSVSLDQLRADTLLSVRVFEARSIVVQAGGSTEAARTSARVRIRRESDGTRWMFDAPHTGRANKTEVELVINDLNALHAKSFPAGVSPSPATAPGFRVTLEGNNRQETLFLGEPVRAPAANAPGTEYYAQLEGRAALFTVVVPKKLLDNLRNAQEVLREKRFLEFEPAAVTAVTLAGPLQPNLAPLTLQRLEPPAGQAANAAPSWQIVRRGDGGGTAQQALPADRAAVQRLLERLALLSADKFKSDAPTAADLEEWGFNRPAREVAITSPGNATPLVLRLGTDANRNVYARVGTPTDPGTSIYQVGADILNDLPLTPLAWRDRAVAEPLPPAAKITALKLTDLENKQTLFETTLKASGEPESARRDPKAVQAVVAGLRALRAKEFVPGGYAERVSAAGDERPWRFRLDATIALPVAGAAEQTSTLTLMLTERLGGAQQFAGSPDLNVVFALEEPMVLALWTLAYGARDPGARIDREE